MNAEGVGRILARARGGPERNLWLGALLAAEARTDAVIVGGSAIEIYTNGAYASEYLDLVGERPAIISVLERWEFRREGRLWARRDLRLWVDPVGTPYTGDIRRLREVTTPYGRVRLASVEDLVAKRLIEAKVRPKAGTDMFEQALVLAEGYSEDVDWDYVLQVADRDRAGDLVPELRRRIAEARAAVDSPRTTRPRATRARGDSNP